MGLERADILDCFDDGLAGLLPGGRLLEDLAHIFRRDAALVNGDDRLDDGLCFHLAYHQRLLDEASVDRLGVVGLLVGLPLATAFVLAEQSGEFLGVLTGQYLVAFEGHH